MTYEYEGLVGLYDGLVGEYDGDVGLANKGGQADFVIMNEATVASANGVTRQRGTHEYDGLVGEYEGDVGEYDGLVGEYDGLVGEYDGDVGEYDGLVGLCT